MAVTTFTDLSTRGATIENETVPGANTAARVGSVIKDLADTTADKISTILVKDTVPSTVVGTGENVVKSYTIPANTLEVNDFFRIACGTVEKSGTVSSTICRIKISNTDDFASSSQIMQAQISGSNQRMMFNRDFSIHNGNIKGYSFLSSVFTDKFQTTAPYDTAPIDVTLPIYVFVSIQNYGTGDTAYLNDLLIIT